MVAEQLDKTENFLAAALNDGWCPYYFKSAKIASTEATAWAAIAICQKQPALAKKAIEFLIANQNEDGVGVMALIWVSQTGPQPQRL